jgi:hypothetical protein
MSRNLPRARHPLNRLRVEADVIGSFAGVERNFDTESVGTLTFAIAGQIAGLR